MKRDFLKELLTSGKEQEEIINEIMSTNGNDIEQARANVKVDETKYVLKTQFDELQTTHTNTLNEFNAYKETTKDYEDIRTSYNNLLLEKESTKKVDYLKGLKCKHPDLVIDKFDWSKVDFEKNEIDKDYLTEFKGKYSSIFESEETPYNPPRQTNPSSNYNPSLGEVDYEALRKL